MTRNHKHALQDVVRYMLEFEQAYDSVHMCANWLRVKRTNPDSLPNRSEAALTDQLLEAVARMDRVMNRD